MYNTLTRLSQSRQMSSTSYNANANNNNNNNNNEHFGQVSNAPPSSRSSKSTSTRSTLPAFGFRPQAQPPPPLQQLNIAESNSSSNYASMLSLNEINSYFSHPSALIGQTFKDQNSGPNNPKYSSSTVAANVWSVPSSMPDMNPVADVAFSKLPFYEELATLISPRNLIPTTQVTAGRPTLQEFITPFTLSVDHANKISTSRKIIPLTDAYSFNTSPKIEFEHMLLLRFALTNLATNDDKVVEDIFPPSLCLKINSKMVTLPANLPVNKASLPKDAFKPARPIDITPLIKITPTAPNTIAINWMQPALQYNPNCVDHGKRFAFALYLVKKVTPDELTAKVRAKGIKSPEFTKSIIMDKLQDEDMEIATTFLRASIQCPVRIDLNCFLLKIF